MLKNNIKFVGTVLNMEWLTNKSQLLDYLVIEYVPGIWVSLVNSLNLLIVDKLSKKIH